MPNFLATSELGFFPTCHLMSVTTPMLGLGLPQNNIPDALESKCAKCTDAQKKLVRKSSRHMKEHNPDEWKQLIDHFDPEGKYSETFEMFLSSED
uniref:Uncharacterized protein n=1 Tax=Timema poppense TaxID=170557 RepID=A0A7R9D7U9_TIMPO|nr:unnamed protein product [Timema poppensis]